MVYTFMVGQTKYVSIDVLIRQTIINLRPKKLHHIFKNQFQ